MFQNNLRIGLIWFNLFEYAQSNVCVFFVTQESVADW